MVGLKVVGILSLKGQFLGLNTDYGRIESLFISRIFSELKSLNTDYGRIERLFEKMYLSAGAIQLNTDYGRIESTKEELERAAQLKLNTDYGRIESALYCVFPLLFYLC